MTMLVGPELQDGGSRDGSELAAATLARVESLRHRIGRALTRRQHDDAQRHPMRGLVITHDDAARLITSPVVVPSPPEPDPLPLALTTWAERAGLDRLDIDLLMVALAPDLDSRFEQWFGFLHDDVTRRRASAGLALQLAGLSPTVPGHRRRLTPHGRLADRGLIELGSNDRPFASRELSVPDSVMLGLLGDDEPVLPIRQVEHGHVRNGWVDALASSLRRGAVLVYVRDARDRSAFELVASALRGAFGDEHRSMSVDLTRSDEQAHTVVAALRMRSVRGAPLVVEGADEALRSDPRLGDRLLRLASTVAPVVLIGRSSWDPDWASGTPLTLDAPVLTFAERESAWRHALGSDAGSGAAESTLAFRLNPERIRRASAAARLQALHRAGPVGADDVRVGARLQNSAALGRLARRIEPRATWDDLVVDPAAQAALWSACERVRHRPHVLDTWGLRRGGGRGEGITALFAGPSGTGKTLAAEVIAHDLGVDLHTIDLSSLVDKYIGETEKNLDRVFEAAEQTDTVLFFDEADAVFGKRSEVKDARDRYANVEVAYLLQRMEQFDGLVVLATNLRLNMDEAFARRLDVTVDFPKPTPAARSRLWHHLVGDRLPIGPDVDLQVLAKSFDLAGGSIRNAVVTAAYEAASQGREVSMPDLIGAVAGEYHKLGRLCLESEFGDWFWVIDQRTIGPAGSR
ncbi:SpoVK/Ycf46/Vps4 family AAA+-type ATPase [Ilumatobacter fluminis]|uniref:SpoVK/Ycf46/Vps4 family AAA+-type ATPase n=1 Tax=Ilumatobacter fluminis TaxID=467091 RepID=A0A4R7I0R1_9ACTN|nr:ATP-binding protein [Ilumatobacter fluminis]TDT17031.1 SpoVK/Ycf46/Vps4 family AAA+-type ATPase [Ilumatobacter fluminis]